MKKIFLTLCMALSLLTTAWASDLSGQIRTLVNSFKHEPGFEVVDLGSVGLGLLKAAARAEARTPEDRQALELFDGIKRLTILDCSEAAPRLKERFLRQAQRLLANEEVLLEARSDGETVRIYGVSRDDENLLEDIVILAGDGIICLRGTIRIDQIEALMNQVD